jgi:hypothetical protein
MRGDHLPAGESAEVRVRLRDGDGKPVTDAAVNACALPRREEGGHVQLSAEENAGGLYRGRTAALEPATMKWRSSRWRCRRMN